MATNIDILTEIRDMRKDFGERLGLLETSAALTNQSIERLTGKVNKIDEVVITGNGDEPLKQTVRDTKNKLDCHLDEMKTIDKEKKDNRTWFNRLVIGAIVAQTVGWIFLIVKGYII